MGSSETKLSGSSLVPLGAACAVALAVIGGTWQISAAFNQFSSRLDRLEARIESSTADRWTASDMERWAYKLDKANRETIAVPDPRSIRSDRGAQ